MAILAIKYSQLNYLLHSYGEWFRYCKLMRYSIKDEDEMLYEFIKALNYDVTIIIQSKEIIDRLHERFKANSWCKKKKNRIEYAFKQLK